MEVLAFYSQTLVSKCFYIPAPAPDAPPQPGYAEPPQPYSYQYGVHDDYSGANFEANENSDTKIVSGSYTVQLPDGRRQTVTYTADDYNGYVADVQVSTHHHQIIFNRKQPKLFQYEGQAVYPEVKPYKPPSKYPALL